MRKVAFLLCSDVVGGHEFQSIELALIAKKYCDPYIFLNSPKHLMLVEGKGLKYNESEKCFFKMGNFICQFYFGLRNCIRMRNMLREFDQIIVCAGTIEAGISSGIALWGKNIYLYVPMYIDRTWSWGKIGYVYNCLFRFFVVFYKGIITINRIQGFFFNKWRKTYIIPNVINDKVKKQIKLQTNRRLYFAGRLEKPKRVDELILWLDNKDNPFRELVIIGDGSQKDSLLQMSLECKYIKVIFYGWLDNMQQENILHGDDILVLNSLYEGEPLVIREANSRKSIVIARNILGVRGCTHPSNRFNTAEELLGLLKLADVGKLRVCENSTEDQIRRIRDYVAKQIFA